MGKYLYHYTSMYNAFQIINMGKLRFSRPADSNDINERVRDIYVDFKDDASEEDLDRAYQEAVEKIHKYVQLSFTEKGKREGYAIPAMWGHYADRGRGVCFVFDKSALLRKLPTGAHYAPVEYKGVYGEGYTSSVIFDGNEDLLKLFFTKSDDWSYEQEFRVIYECRNPNIPKYVSIKEALIAVIIHYPAGTPADKSVVNSTEYIALKEAMPRVPIKVIGDFLGAMPLTAEDGEPTLPLE
ncbi:MAG: DUF2971 domain-containing protein [Muribaculaceae bacterium]|nr:DUF2971 domain-containing protein [Muribaculaceae bacterium]